MPVAASDMKIYLSGGVGNTNPNASIGGQISSTQVADNTIDNLFDDILSAEAIAGGVNYRCCYLKNTHASDDLNSAVIWINSNTPNANTTVAIGLDPSGVSNGLSPSAGSPSPLDESTPPPGVTFSTPITEGTALAIGTILDGQSQAIWIRRTVTAGAPAAANDPFVLKVSGLPA